MSKTKNSGKEPQIVVTQEILDLNPELVEAGVKVGETIGLGPSVKIEDLLNDIDGLKEELSKSSKAFDKLTKENQLIIADRDKTKELLETEKNKCKEVSKELEAAKNELSAAKADIDRMKADPPSVIDQSPLKKVKVHHGVVVGTKTYTKKEIEADETIQEFLIASGSSAISVIE